MIPANLFDDRQLVQVEASVIWSLHDVLSVLLNVLADIWHAQQFLN